MTDTSGATKPIETMRVDAIATVDVRDASAEGVALMRQRVENQKKMLTIAIGLTSPNQWTVFAGTGKDGVYRESIYPTGGAADTILRRAFGLTWGEKSVTIEETKDGPEAVSVAWLMQGKIPVEEFEGRRRMGGFIKTEADMRKGAVENMKSVAVRDLLGLRFRTPTELKEMGLDVGKLERRAEFQNRGTDESGVAKVPFGNQKGKVVTELTERELAWHIGAAQKRIPELLADPEKKKWAPREQSWLNALLEEQKRRVPAATASKTEQPSQDTDYGPPPMTDEEIAATNGKKSEVREPGQEG